MERGNVVTVQGKAVTAYREIERMIVFQEIAPGSLVSEAMIMEKTGLGRTPIREALQRLARNRMVEIHPNRGVLIPPTSVEAQLKLLELRRALEGLAVRLACQRADDDQRRRMRSMVESLRNTDDFSLKEYAETVKGTHDLIVEAAKNEYLADAMAPLQGLSRRFWFTHVVDDAAEIKAGAALHTSILEAILKQDEDTAERCSYDLNDYLVDFSYASLRLPRARER
jgi:DNA-binding GntR family transcriptional regulator